MSFAKAQDTPPPITSFGWANQGTCVAATNPSGTITMFHPGAAGLGFNWCVMAEALPAAPYTIITRISGHIFDKAQSLGITLFDATTSKFIVYSLGSSDTGVASLAGWKMNSYTSYAGAYFTYNNSMVTGGLIPKYLRIKDNGTFRTLAVSQDKEVWFTVHIVSNSDFILPTHFGYTLRGTGNGASSLMTIYHETITTP
jgi:hypothetical protein